MERAEPRVDMNSRQSLIDWLQWNDPNGMYTDNDARSQGMEPLDLREAQDLYMVACAIADRGEFTTPLD